ncbi:hypothetical protein ACFXKT_40230, partial [Streptomyces mirabilis]
MSAERREHDELQGEGWSRLLAAARRRLERTSGALDGDIGLAEPPDAEPRPRNGLTGPEPGGNPPPRAISRASAVAGQP